MRKRKDERLPPQFVTVPCKRCAGKGYTEHITGAWLRWARRAAGLTQGELARRIRVSRLQVWRIESGRCPISTAVAARWIAVAEKRR